ncbi:MAG: hypothetical protein VYC39_17690 [Myxococcota bacterium]|nr:hypothetical protein [Myxococcota bacterium]
MPNNIYFYFFHGILLGVLWLNFQASPPPFQPPCSSSQPLIVRNSGSEIAIRQLSGEVRSLGQQLHTLRRVLPNSMNRRDPFSHPSLFVSVSPSPTALKTESKVTERTFESASKVTNDPLAKIAKNDKQPEAESSVSVEELPTTHMKPKNQLHVRTALEKPKSKSIELDGYQFSLTALTGQQERLLRTIAKIPSMPTEYIRGLRYVRVGSKRYLDDCSNVLRIAYDDLGIDLFSERYHYPKANGVRLIRMKGLTSAASTSSTTVAVGDLVIFDNTYDRNKNNRLDDRDTHAAIVVGFEDSDTAVIYHRVRSGHKIGRLNLRESHRVFSRKGRRRFNDVLRRVAKRDRHKVPRLTGQLFATYVRVIPPETMPLSYVSK